MPLSAVLIVAFAQVGVPILRAPGELNGGTIYGTGGHELAAGERESVSFSGYIVEHAGGEIALTCERFRGNVDVNQASLIAIKVDSFI